MSEKFQSKVIYKVRETCESVRKEIFKNKSLITFEKKSEKFQETVGK